MEQLSRLANSVFNYFRSVRFWLLGATVIVMGIIGFIITRFPYYDDIHALAGLYAEHKLALKEVAQWKWPSFLSWLTLVQLTYLELLIDTLFFIPLYSFAAWVWAGYFAHEEPTVNRKTLFTKLLSWLWPWIPPLIGITILADLMENVCLTIWIFQGHPPVYEAVMEYILALKFWPIGFVVGYTLLVYSISKSFVQFITELWRTVWSVFKLITINKYVRCGITMLRTVWPTVLVLVFTYLFLNLMDQAHDLLDALVLNPFYSFWVFFFLLLYALVVWYSTRIIFILKDQRFVVEVKYDEQAESAEPASSENLPEPPGLQELNTLFKFRYKNDISFRTIPPFAAIDLKTLQAFTRWTPVLLGLVPFVALLKALGNLEDTGWHQIALVVEIFVYLGIAYRVKNYVDGSIADDCNIHPHLIRDLRPNHKTALWIALVGCLLLIVLASIWKTNLAISQSVGPVSIVFLALSMWALIASFFTYLDYRYKAPFTLICLLIMMFLNNNNHQIRTMSAQEGGGSYFSKDATTHRIPVYFETWLDSLRAENKTKDTISTIPVYLISTEGGGIRSAYWTATVLQQLDSIQPDFFRHVFAISGVSGGSVGATVFTAQYRDRLINPKMKFNVDKYFERDYLSPLLTAMLIPDMLQKFSPVVVNSVDRARYLEDGWAEAYQDDSIQSCNPNPTRFNNATPAYHKVPDSVRFRTLDKSFLSLWDSDPSKKYKLPVLFLNATQAETGRKGLMTPLVINGDKQFENVIDIQEEVYRHIPLKTAASISARFPIVTPPATIRVVNKSAVEASNFVDGGYLDNSGTTTLLSILSSITSDEKCLTRLYDLKKKNIKVEFRIISINNSVETNPNQHVESLKGLYELKAPLQAFFKAWDNSGDYRLYAVKEYARGFSNEMRTKLLKENDTTNQFSFIASNLYTINLNRKTGIIPLGWDLSKQAEERIREQARKLNRTLRERTNPEYVRLLANLKESPGRVQNTQNAVIK